MTSAVESEPDLKFSRGGRRSIHRRGAAIRLSGGRPGRTSTTILPLLPCSSYDAHTRARTHMVDAHAGRRVSYFENSIGRSIREIRDAATSRHSILDVAERAGARARSLAEKSPLVSSPVSSPVSSRFLAPRLLALSALSHCTARALSHPHCPRALSRGTAPHRTAHTRRPCP